jgi:hypothetical protein
VSAFSRRPLSPFAAYSRSRCTECRSPRIAWSSALDLAWSIAPAERLRLFELIAWCGEDADAWRCEECGAWGVFDSGGA